MMSAPAANVGDARGGLKPEEMAFFEKNIRPVLIAKCYDCHSMEKKQKGGLVLDSREGLLAGGESGHAGVVPGDVAGSSLYEAITWANEDMQMPPKEKLSAEVIANFKKWIEMGAPDPRVELGAGTVVKRGVDVKKGRKHWAFQKPVKAPLPQVQRADWPLAELDHWVLTGLEKRGLKPAAAAERTTLLRRIAFDLTGLPPTPDEVRAFLADSSPDAVKRVVDMYLDSEAFGERWGRHWLDVARYAESSGKDVNVLYPHAWRYRDYVIESFKKDKPYDVFLKEQIAGDLMNAADKRDEAEKIVATGFLAIGPKGHNTRDRRQFAVDVADEQIDTLTQSMLGVTLACARCHDHKFDPFSMRDYYAMAGILMSSDTLYGTHEQLQNQRPGELVELSEESGLPAALAKISVAEVETLRRRKAQADQVAEEALANVRREGAANDPAGAFLRVRALRDQAATRGADLELFLPDGTPRLLAMGALDKAAPTNAPVLNRGELDQPGGVVSRGLVEVLCAEGDPLSISQGSGRLDLAYWIASKDNPLTARVMVNRVWLKLFGKGIVDTPDNFGAMGGKPSHPELLDSLAVGFMEDGWSVKRLIKSIMLSRTYQMSSASVAANEAIDPGNESYWRMNQRRLDAEAIRDGMLAVSGELERYPVAGSAVARAGDGREGLILLLREVATMPQKHRSVYLPIVRDQIPEMLSLFDFPDASLVTGERDTTNVPSQSLYLMNSPQVQEYAAAMARRLETVEGTPQERLMHAFWLAYGRAPKPEEGQALRQFFTDFMAKELKGKGSASAKAEASKKAAAVFCQSLIASAEFRYLR
jgi:hypothetical protein